MYQLSYINQSPPLWNLFGINSWSCSWKIHSTFSTSLPHHPLAITYHGVMLSSVHHWNWITYQNTTDKCFVHNSSFCLQSEQIVVKNYTENEYFEMIQMHQHENVMISLNCMKSCIDDITELYWALHLTPFLLKPTLWWGAGDEINLFSPSESLNLGLNDVELFSLQDVPMISGSYTKPNSTPLWDSLKLCSTLFEQKQLKLECSETPAGQMMCSLQKPAIVVHYK